MSERTGRKPTRTFLAYVAGLVDGEGCLRLKDNLEEVSITSCYPHHLYRIQKHMGGKIRSFPPSGPKRGCYRLEIRGAQAKRMLRMILPYMLEKKYQATLLLTAKAYPPNSQKYASIEGCLRLLKRVDYTFFPEDFH